MLTSRSDPAWLVGLHRAMEVFLGILISLLVSPLWNEDRNRERQG